jgi:hypothetical protein
MSEEPKFDARLAEGVAYFEQMLQLMPEDRTTLEFLVVAYNQLGRSEDEQRALVSLAKILVKERDLAALEGLLPRLEECDNAEARAIALKVRTMVAPAPDLTPEAPRELTETEKVSMVSRAAVAAELALVESLVADSILGEEDAKNVREHIGATPMDGRAFLISALQILEKENPPLAEKCMAHLADKCGASPIPLSAFDPPRDLVAKFPDVSMCVRGAVPFAHLGNVALIAVLNPADEALRAEFNAVMPCRFYLADAASVESALASLFSGEEAKS